MIHDYRHEGRSPVRTAFVIERTKVPVNFGSFRIFWKFPSGAEAPDVFKFVPGTTEVVPFQNSGHPVESVAGDEIGFLLPVAVDG